MSRKIIILTYDYPPNNGGIARLCFEIKKEMERRSMPVLVIALADTNTDMENDKNVVRISGRRGFVEWKILYYLRQNTSKDDIILTGTFHPDGLLGILSNRDTYMLAHGAEFLLGRSFFRRKVWGIYRKWVLKQAKMVIANSHYTGNLVKSCSPDSKVVSIPLAVDIEYFHPTAPKRNDGFLHLCSISRLEKFKGHDFIIKTIASLPSEYKNRIRLRIGGKGAYKMELEDLVSQLNLSQIVFFDGFVADNQLCDFYSSADIFILCTREESENRNVEGFGIVFTEAQACGTAVIGTRTGGIPDAVVEGNGGWLIRQDSEEDLRALLIKLVDDSSIKIEEGQKARERMENEMNWGRYMNDMLDVIFSQRRPLV